MPAPSYIAKDRHGGYLFRITIPKQLRPCLAQKVTIRQSLKTHHRPTALRLARALAVEAEHLFAEVAMKEKYITRIMITKGKIALEKGKIIELVSQLSAESRLALTSEDGSTPELDKVLASKNPHEHRISELQNVLKENEVKLQIALQVEERTRMSDLESEVYRDYGLQPLSTTSQSHSHTNSPNLSHLWGEYRSLKIRNDEWEEGTSKDREREGTFRDFLEIIGGDIPASSLSAKHASTLIDGLKAFPKNRQKIHKGIPLHEIPENAPKISQSSASQRLDLLIPFFKYMLRKKHINEDWLSDYKIERNSQSYPTPSQQDIGQWFNLPEKLIKNAWQFWIPRIALLMGARQNEIAQLTIDDIIQDHDSGLYCINFTDSDQKKLKTKASKRKIPLHPLLIEHGLLGYIDEVKKAGHTELWPNLREKAGKKGQTVTRYWTELRSKYNVLSHPQDESGNNKVFHSLRRVLINKLNAANVELTTIQCIVGHEPSLGATKDYLDAAASIEQMKAAIDKMPIFDISWEHPMKLSFK